MQDHSPKLTTSDHSIGNIMIVSLLIFCGLTFVFLLGIF
jgi:hypothetical protein